MQKTEQIIDARGMQCPKPLMMVKRVFEEVEIGTKLLVLLDNDIARENVERFLADNAAVPQTTISDGEMSLLVEKRQHARIRPDTELRCSDDGTQASGPYIMVFSSNGMGRGSEELGNILMQACINTIAETSPCPDMLVFYNAGVHLAVEGSPVLESLQRLAGIGVNMLVCGTCLDYYQLKEQLRVGSVSNMFDILEQLAAARKVVYP